MKVETDAKKIIHNVIDGEGCFVDNIDIRNLSLEKALQQAYLKGYGDCLFHIGLNLADEVYDENNDR